MQIKKSDLKIMVALQKNNHGFSSILELSKSSGIHRNTARASINRLIKNGLLEYHQRGFKKTASFVKISTKNIKSKNITDCLHSNIKENMFNSYPQTYPQGKNISTNLYIRYPQTYPQANFESFSEPQVFCKFLAFFVHLSKLTFDQTSKNCIYSSARSRGVITNIYKFNEYCYSKKWPKNSEVEDLLLINKQTCNLLKKYDFCLNGGEIEFLGADNSNLNEPVEVFVGNECKSDGDIDLKAPSEIQEDHFENKCKFNNKDLISKRKMANRVLSDDEEVLFKIFWAAYPLKVRKDLAKVEFGRIIWTTSIDCLLKALVAEKVERHCANSMQIWYPPTVRAYRWLKEKRFL